MNPIYVCIARRWGEDESHNYICGVFTNKHAAVRVAENTCTWRAGKYNIYVYECLPDVFELSDTNMELYGGDTKLIYEAKGLVK